MAPLLESSIRALLVAGGVALVVYALGITNARARHLAWCGVLAAMLLLPALSTWAPKFVLRVLPRSPEVAALEPLAPTSPVAAPPSISAPPRSTPAATAPKVDPLWTGYLAVAGLMLMRLLYGARRVASLRRRARPEAGFRSSAEVACPITVGWWRPAILLPASWTEWPAAELDAVLAHERAHVRRRDPLVQWLAALNRCIFWFHPLAWWLEHRLSALAEIACDADAIASGLDPRDYSEYLIHQARAVGCAGARVAIPGSTMGRGVLGHRIRLLLDPRPAPSLGSFRGILAAALCLTAIAAFSSCRLERAERPAAGQPTMNELAHRRAESNRQYMDRQKAIVDLAQSLTADEAQQLFARLKENPQDADKAMTLLRHYEFRSDVAGLRALKLWYIEHQPTDRMWTNIDPRIDRAGYEQGKALWLTHLKQPGAAAEIYQRAADFLDGGDKPLTESVLQEGRKRYPDDRHWSTALGRHYAQVLLGSAEPVTEYNVIRKVSAEEARSPYAQSVRARLAESRDARVLAETAMYLTAWGRARDAALELARTYAERARSLAPDDIAVRSIEMRLADMEKSHRLKELRTMTPAELSAAPAADRIVLASDRMFQAWLHQNFAEAEKQAREVLDLAGQNRNDPQYADAVFQADMLMGKAALHRGDRKTSVRYLMAAAETPGSDRIRRGDFEMNLPRALVDWGERRAVADFYRRMALKTTRTKQYQDWAADLDKGINPDLIPTFSAPGCTNDPC